MLVERINIPNNIYPASNADKTTARIKGTVTPDAVSREEDRRERRENNNPEQQTAQNPAQEEEIKALEVPASAEGEKESVPVEKVPRLDIRA